ncbi:MAG TPA: CRTAC1 family protein [Candidatus Deferrimicrobium sp.]|nr:CRTAC1 family protein [Candidatus Deferrimicrobium sp.]
MANAKRNAGRSTFIPGLFARHAARFVAVVLIGVIYVMAKLPEPSEIERQHLSSQFKFETLTLPELSGYTYRSVRNVCPSMAHISAWISSVGASVALNDLDQDGLPNDLCWVDPRIDQVILAPVPGTQPRYAPFVLNPYPLPYDKATMAPMGCLPGDVNEDGLVDIIVYYWGRTPIAFLRRQTGYMPQEIYSQNERWFTNAATLADVDGDGHADLIIGNYFPDDARILDTSATDDQTMQRSMSRAYNGGKNRLLLWQSARVGNDPSVTFAEAVDVFDEKVAHAWTLAIGAADLDGDLLPEIYFANDFGSDRLLHNRSKPGKPSFALLEGERELTTPSSSRLGHDSFKGMGTDFADLNGDGLLDIYVSNIAAEYALEESHFCFLSTGDTARMKQGIAPYHNAAEQLGLARSGWAWESRLADFNNDGIAEAIQATGFVKGQTNRWPELQELAMANDNMVAGPGSWPRFQPGDDVSGRVPRAFFAKTESCRYVNIAADIGLDVPMVSRGIAVADVDGDGDLDFAVANQWERSYFYRNAGPDNGSFLGLHVLLPIGDDISETITHSGHPSGDMSGRPAIGAAARVYMPGGKVLVAQVDGGNGHSGRRSQDLHFGLGETENGKPVTVELSWRDSDGRIRTDTLHLTPGWHTILLGSATKEGV